MRRGAALLLVLALSACGRDGDAARSFDGAVQALRAGDPDRARALSEQAAAEGGEAYVPQRDFVRGNVAFAKSEAAEAAAARPGADRTLMERSRAFAEDALASWRLAAGSRADWPAARRNVERALLRLDRLREKKGGGSNEGPKPPTPKPPTDGQPPPPPPPPPPPLPEPPKDLPAAYDPPDLPTDRVGALLEVLRRKEAERQAVRKATRRETSRTVERDW